MSHSPAKQGDEAAAAAERGAAPGQDAPPSDPVEARYLQAWLALGEQVLRGRSFSGRERHHAFINLGGARFADASAAVGIDLPEDGRALATADLDDDGDFDVVISHRSAPRLRILRNDAPRGHVLGLRLVAGGDAGVIGARVVVHASAADGSARGPFVAATAAGDGFIAQSSAALRIGLGDATQITKLEVVWPGGKRESFETAKLSVDAAFVLTRGQRRPKLRRRWRASTAGGGPAARPTPATNTSPSHAAAKTAPIGPQRVFFSSRIAAPPLRFTGLGGQMQALAPAPGKPVLVVLWASWCKPCLDELRELGRRRAELAAAGVEVVALSVDGLPDGERITPEAAQARLQQLGFKGQSGVAVAPLVARYELTLQLLTMARRPLPLPTSFLISPVGELAAAYKGRLDVSRMLADAKVGDDVADRRAAAVVAVREGPLPVGRWIYPIVDVDIRSLAMRYVRAKMPDVAVNLFEGRIRREPKVAAHHNDLGVLFAQMGELEPATKAFAVAVELDPNDVAARRNLEYAQRQLREGPPGGGAAPRGPTPPPRAPD